MKLSRMKASFLAAGVLLVGVGYNALAPRSVKVDLSEDNAQKIQATIKDMASRNVLDVYITAPRLY